MPMVLEWDVQQAHIGVMVRCPLTFGHIVYIRACPHVGSCPHVSPRIEPATFQLPDNRSYLLSYCGVKEGEGGRRGYLPEDLPTGGPAAALAEAVDEPQQGEHGHGGGPGERHVDAAHQEEPDGEEPAGADLVRQNAADELADRIRHGLAAGDQACAHRQADRQTRRQTDTHTRTHRENMSHAIPSTTRIRLMHYLRCHGYLR